MQHNCNTKRLQPTIRDNEVELKLTGINILSFEVLKHSVSSGQPYGGVSVVSPDKLNVKAGRHGTSQVAADFRTWADHGVVIGCQKDDAYPRDLNFAVYGTLTFEHGGKTYQIKEMILAQGHNHAGRNNWWLGGPHMKGGSFDPFVGAAIAEANVKGHLPAEVAFSASFTCISHFDVAIVGL